MVQAFPIYQQQILVVLQPIFKSFANTAVDVFHRIKKHSGF